MSDTLLFPSAGALASNHNLFLLVGPLLLVILLLLLWRWVRRPYRPGLQHLAIVLGLLVVGLGFLFGVYTSVGTGVAFRRLPLRNIRALEIEAIDGELARRGMLLRIESPAAVRSGLSLLPEAEAYRPEHEHFVDGYRVRLVLANGGGTTSYYVSAFCGTQRLGRPVERTAIVVPHRDLSHQAFGFGGTYRSRSFVSWLTARLRQADPRSVYPNCG